MGKRKFLTIFLLLFISLSIPPHTATAVPADVQTINGKDYYPAVKKAIQEAEKSIYMVMYQVALHTYDQGSKVYKLVDELIEAHNRGVTVKVILDQNIDFVSSDYIEDRQTEGKNAWCFKMLKEAGIDVQYDDLTTYAHTKAIVIDGEIVIMGSANWSASAFDRNTETNVRIKSKEVARDNVSYFDEIKVDEDADTTTSVYVPISWKFLENPRLAGRMLRESDKRIFDVYLLLLRRHCEIKAAVSASQPTPPVIANQLNPPVIARRPKADEAIPLTFDYDAVADYLGMSSQMNRIAYRRQLIKTLRKLKNQYKLIKFEPEYAKNATVTLISYDDPEAPYSHPKGWFFQVPDKFWIYEWDQKLSFRAKYCYFINLAYVGISNAAPWWYSNREVLSKRFNTTKESISKGMGELRRLNLIDVSYGTPKDGDYSNRAAKSYKLLPLYDPKWLESEWERLREAYGDEKLNKARKYAKIVFKENDPQDVEEIIIALSSLGEKIVKKAFAIVAKKNIDNPKRCYAYVKGIIRNLQK